MLCHGKRVVPGRGLGYPCDFKRVLVPGLMAGACHTTHLWCALGGGTEVRWPREPGVALLPTSFPQLLALSTGMGRFS